MKTHFAAVKNGIVVGTRSSASRSIEGTGKFGPYTHAILRTERITTKETNAVTESTDVISWHGGLANASSGLRAAQVGWSWERTWTAIGEEAGMTRTTEYVDASIVEVVITPRPAKVGQRMNGEQTHSPAFARGGEKK